jgi:hypothetical protein
MLKISRGDRIRTCDPLVPNQVRYQLRYAPNFLISCNENGGEAGIRTRGTVTRTSV